MKKTKEEVRYSLGTDDFRCENCKHYQLGGYCFRVRGDIQPTQVCMLFTISKRFLAK